MKKNILTVVIMAATVINLVLTAVLVFSIMPAMNKTTNLIDKVASVIDLEIETKDESDDWTMEDLQSVTITYEKKETLNLQPDDGDEASHYFQMSGINISLNSKAEDFQGIFDTMNANTVYAENAVKQTISSYTKSTFDQNKVAQDCVKKLNEMYNTKCIVQVIFEGPLLN